MVSIKELMAKLSDFSRAKYEHSQKIKDIKFELSRAIDELRIIEKEVGKKIEEQRRLVALVKEAQEGAMAIAQSATSTHPWLAKIFSDLKYIEDGQIARQLKTKSNPAVKAADAVQSIAREKRELLRQLKESEYKINYYEALFPSLIDHIDDADDSENNLDVDMRVDDVVRLYLTDTEYAKLNVLQRNQLALDRYKNRKHSKAHIGKIYERYIGWLYEQKGYTVTYYGIKNGLNDLGRDLICENEAEVCVVQCKCWSREKQIHENAICQLYGSVIHCKIEDRKCNPELFQKAIVPVFVTTTRYSDTALEFATELGVACYQRELSLEYPMIKCNISASGEKIYHLPFDQQYDNTHVNQKNEMYVLTVQEAERAGFRRAKRWTGRND